MFNEKKTEKIKGAELQVIQTEKYREAKETAQDVMKKYGLREGDFWILKNKSKGGDYLLYSGLIISHNGALKINDQLPEEKKFKPSSMTVNENGYRGCLVYTYINDAQGIYEVGEVSASNCDNDYPYAMALKRCIDRVILKNSRIAYAGIYSEVEAAEFREPDPEKKAAKTEEQAELDNMIAEQEKAHKAAADLTRIQAEVKDLREKLHLSREDLVKEFEIKKAETPERWMFIKEELERRMKG